ncbi:molybdenum cofactor guanylyltransferase [Planomicrobium okeanokoites]|uniref:molybdenum cofactor guanylyltransferase n=1 Tax=Planomicrobium okeanokoites TaxID=244 RepID=UPI002491B6F7|nr:molybdenum cofactor guanylyltransferase [Planomicrobium okeanokoites]
MKTVGILLAGGLSRRFGSPKAFAKIGDDYFYEKVHQALSAVCDEVVIVTRKELVQLFPQELEVATDHVAVSGRGPLAGISTAMKLKRADRYMVLPCDMPFIGPAETRELLKLVNSKAQVTAVKTEDEKIPLFSIWAGNFAEELEQAIGDEKLSVFDFLNSLETTWIDHWLIHPNKDKFRNINRNSL